jgi:hypothetical protein
MKHVCVAARIGDSKALDAGNSRSIAKSSNAASRGGRSRLQTHCAWMRLQNATLSVPDSTRLMRAYTVASPYRGPCSTLRCADDSGCNPYGLSRVLAPHFVASHWLRMTKRRVLLRVLSQNRDSASRVSLC